MTAALSGDLRERIARAVLDGCSIRQAADARMWAGVHYPSDVEAGRVMGEAVAKQAIVLESDVPMR